MVAAGVLGGLTLVMLEITKQQAAQSVDSKISFDLTQMKSEIQTYLSSPAHCNANFYGRGPGPASPSPTAIFRCTSTTTPACHSAPGSGNSSAKITVNNSNWFNTGSISERVRVSALSLSVEPLTPVAPAVSIITTGTLIVTFQSYTLRATNSIKTEIVTFNTPVLFGSGGTVIGCPQSWNSTLPY